MEVFEAIDWSAAEYRDMLANIRLGSTHDPRQIEAALTLASLSRGSLPMHRLAPDLDVATSVAGSVNRVETRDA